MTIKNTDFKKGSFALWRGFQHNWLYNHRTNRIGSFIDKHYSKFTVNHSAASGTGADTLHFQDEYSIVQKGDFSFYSNKVFFNLKEKKGHTIAFRKDLVIKLKAGDKNINFGALLNGFELIPKDYSKNKMKPKKNPSSKLHLLDIEIREIYRNADELKLAVLGSLNLDCKSIECTISQTDFDYDLDIHFIILKGKKQDFDYEKSSGPITNHYSWKKTGKKNEKNLLNDGVKEDVLFLKNSLEDFDSYAIGYRKMSLIVHNLAYGPDKSVHMLDVNINIKEFRPFSTNQIHLRHEIFFRNWRRKMQSSGNSSWVSFGQQGSFKGEVRLGVFRFKDTQVKLKNNTGTIFWKGEDKSAHDKDALVSKEIDFNFNHLIA